MKKNFHVFFLFALFLLFAVNAAWAGNLTLKTNSDGEQYIVMPSQGTSYFNIDAGTPNFKIRATSSGGTSAFNKKHSIYGTLVLTAPEGYIMRISGLLGCGSFGEGDVSIYEGETLLLSVKDEYTSDKDGVLQSVGNTMTFNVKNSKKENLLRAGLEVTVLPLKTVTLKQTVGGTVKISKTISYQGDTLTVSGTPNDGYLLQGLEIRDGNRVLDMVQVDWYSENPVATFIMPDANVTVTPVFSNDLTVEGGFFVNMRKSKYMDVQIPAKMTSFKVYDDGGKDGNYSLGESKIDLTAPKGYLFQVTGFVKAVCSSGNCDRIIIYSLYGGDYEILFNYEDAVYKANTSLVNVGTLRLGNKMRVALNPHFSEKYKKTTTAEGIDLTVDLIPASTISLSENDTLTYQEISRTNPLTIYSNLKTDGDANYTLESRHAVGSEWSDWTTMLYGRDQNFDWVDEGWAFVDDPADSYERSFSIPAKLLQNDYEYMEFRYVLYPRSGNGIDPSGKMYTSTVKVRLMNEVSVKTNLQNVNNGENSEDGDKDKRYYSLMTSDGTAIEKGSLIPHGTVVKVQALAPAKYKFHCWADPESPSKCSSHTENPRTVAVVSDTSLRALFQPDNDEVKLSMYISMVGKTAYTAEDSLLEVNSKGSVTVTASIVVGNGNTECPNSRCNAYVVVRPVGSDSWDSVGKYIAAVSNNGYTNSADRSVSLSGASRFEIKTIALKANGDTVSTNSVFANLLVPVSMWTCADTATQTRLTDGCGAVIEDELGYKQELGTSGELYYPYGSKLKVYLNLNPEYFYWENFLDWRNGDVSSNSQIYKPEMILSSDSVYEFTLEGKRKILAIGVTPRLDDEVNVSIPEFKEPYAGQTELNLVLAGDVQFAADTAFYIKKNGKMFAVDMLDSMFTPGDYDLTVKLVRNPHRGNVRDSLWSCGVAWVKWIDAKGDYKWLQYVKEQDLVSSCSENTSFTYKSHYFFTVNDTTFNVAFKTWDESSREYVTVGGVQKVAFGQVPTVPSEIVCPESDANWNFSCDWSSDVVAAVKNAEYNYEVTRSNNGGSMNISVENNKPTVTIDGMFNGEESLVIPEEIFVDSVTFNREFKQSGYSTVMFPFDVNVTDIEGLWSAIEFAKMTTEDDGKPAVGMWYVWCDADVQAELKQIAEDNGETEYEHCNDDGYTDGVLHAYTPYMIETVSENLQFKTGVMLEPAPAKMEVRRGDWVFRGTTQKKVWTKAETKDGNVWAYAAKVQDAAKYVGQFVKLGPGAYTQPLRAYMVKEPQVKPSAPVAKGADYTVASLSTENVNPDNLPVVIVSRGNGENGDEHTTIIGRIDASTGEYHWDYRVKHTYDLKGRNVGKPKAKGFYLKK